MTAADLVRAIQQDTKPLVEGLFSELRTNLGTSHYHRLSNDELFRRGHAVYQHLQEWLTTRDTAIVSRYGEELGRKRFSEGIPLGQVILALILNEKHLWTHLGSQGGQPICDGNSKASNSNDSKSNDSLRAGVAEFFARAIYSTAHAYEISLAESNRRAGRAVIPPRQPQPDAAGARAQEETVMPISRGGEVGEHGG